MTKRLSMVYIVVLLLASACSGGSSGDGQSARRRRRSTSPPSTAEVRSTTTTLSAFGVAALGGQSCPQEGDTLPEVSQSAGLNVPYLNHGLRCTGGVWTWIVDIGQSCGSSFGAPPPVMTADGQRPTCVSEHWLLGGQTITSFYSGTYRVGSDTGQIEPGTYRADGNGQGVTDCYWARLDSAGGTIANNFIPAAPQAEVTVEPSDFALNVDGPCGEWKKVS